MNNEHHKTIDTLVGNLTPARRLWPLPAVTLAWLCVSVAYVALAMGALGPLRPGVVQQLLDYPRFGLEMLAGCAALVLFAYAAIGQALPGLATRRVRQVGWLLAIVWLLNFLLGMVAPTLEPSMLGKREHCAWEAFVYSTPPALLAIALQQRRYPLRPLAAGIYAGLAAGLLPAVAMQIACMYEPVHILKFHAAPVLAVAAGAGLCAAAAAALRGRRNPLK